MLENVGTLMATEKDAQEAEDLERMVSLMQENEAGKNVCFAFNKM